MGSGIKRYILLIFAMLLAFSRGAFAQYYTVGSDPAKEKWSRMDSDNFRAIYPAGMDSLARSYLYHFERARMWNDHLLGVKSRRIPLVLHPYSLQANASVAWAPSRADIYTTPPAEGSYADSWVNQLALHEGRHISQMNKLERGIFKPLGWLIGEQVSGLSAGIFAGRTLLEGNAVHSETDFTHAGRGRDPDFLKYYRAAWNEGDFRTFHKWKLGSLRHYTPNCYALGYLEQTALRYYGGEFTFLDKAISTLAGDRIPYNHSYCSFPIGTAKKGDFLRGQRLMAEVWRSEDELRKPYISGERLVAQDAKYYSVYSSVVPVAGGRFLAIKASMDRSTMLVEIDENGNESPLRPFYGGVDHLVVKDSVTVVWAERIPDTRWELEDCSILRSYSITDGKISDLTHSTRYFNPAYTQDGSKVSVTEYPAGGVSKVTVLESGSYSELYSIKAPFEGQITSTAWIGERIYADVIVDDGVGIFSYSADGGWSEEVALQHRSIRHLQSSDDMLVFESDLDGVTEIYSYYPAGKSLKKLTNTPVGAFYPYFDKEWLYYEEYDTKGYHPVRMSRSALLCKEMSWSKPHQFLVADWLSAEAQKACEGLSSDSLESRIEDLEPHRYSKAGHLLHIHSWAPIYYDIDRIMAMSAEELYQLASPGATLISQNILGTAEAQLGYSYGGERHSGHLEFVYSGLYPVIETNFDIGQRGRIDHTFKEDEEGLKPVADTLSAPLVKASLRTYIPFNFSGSGWNRGLVPEMKYDFTNDTHHLSASPARMSHHISAGVIYYQTLSTPMAALAPRWGFGVQFQTRSSLGLSENGSAVAASAYGYFPGLSLTQGVRLKIAGQKMISDSIFDRITGLVSIPRGYKGIYPGNYASAMLDYFIPIYAGDLDLAGIVYLKRLRINPFADGAVNSDRYGKQYLFSYGAEVSVDACFFSIVTGVNVGFRYARYRQAGGRMKGNISLVMGVSL